MHITGPIFYDLIVCAATENVIVRNYISFMFSLTIKMIKNINIITRTTYFTWKQNNMSANQNKFCQNVGNTNTGVITERH